MDEELRRAAIGEIDNPYEFIYGAVKSKPKEYFTAGVVDYQMFNCRVEGGNMFHLAISHKNVDFLEAALKILPEEMVHELLCHQDTHGANPIHLAAFTNCEILLRLFVQYYGGKERTLDLEPWLGHNKLKDTAVQTIIQHCSHNLSMEVLSLLGIESIPLNTEGGRSGNSILFDAVRRGFSRVADKILSSATPYSLSSSDGFNALFYAPNCSKNICERLLRQHFELITAQDTIFGKTVLHTWALLGKMYAFKTVLKEDFIPAHARVAFIDQLCALDSCDENPLHVLASCKYDQSRTVDIAKILVESYKQERAALQEKTMLPWFDKRCRKTPLRIAIRNKNEELAMFFLSLDGVYFVAENDEDDLLYDAFCNGCAQVAEAILDIVDELGLTQLLTSSNGKNVMHVAPYCTEALLIRLLKNYPHLLGESDVEGTSVLHDWISIGAWWPFEFTLKRNYIEPIHTVSFRFLISQNNTKKRKPLHMAAEYQNADVHGAIERIVQLVLDVWYEQPSDNPEILLGWSSKDNEGYTPLARAISNRSEKLSLCFLSRIGLSHDLEIHEKEGKIIFTAIKYKWQRVVRFILDGVHEQSRECFDLTNFLRSNRGNVLHHGSDLSEENCRLVIQRWPKLLYEHDDAGMTPLERASQKGTTWLVELILQMDHRSIIKSPLAWVEACKNSDLSTILAFAQSSYFRNLCREKCDTPLHHLQDLRYKEYQQLLQDASIKELRNIQNSGGETPLHVAIKNENMNFTEILLTMEDVDRTIKDNENKTAMQLLKDICGRKPEWARLCKVLEVDPKVKTTYIQLKTDLAEMRNIISLVAALLATITFTAGFTVPGGSSGDSGEPILVMKAAFSVFLITNSYAMCCSMLILFCMIWSMVCDRNMSSLLIDRSLVLLKQSLYGTLLAFMTGVYTIIHHRSLWAAIVIIIMCSIVVISANRSILYRVLPKLIPEAEDEYELLQSMCFWKRKKPQERVQEATIVNNQNAIQEAATSRSQYELGPDRAV